MWQIIVIFAKNKSALMKKVLLILLFAALLPFAAADAQNIALGERVPELKSRHGSTDRNPRPRRG